MSRPATAERPESRGGLRLQVTNNSKGQSQIDLTGRKIILIPADIFTFTHVQVLKLTNNEIHHVPSSISHLRSLKVLHLDKNRLTSIPETISNCKNLTELNLSANGLEVLPMSLCSLKKLRILNVSNNQMEQLPHDIGHLCDLRHLVLQNNKLWYLPFSVTNLHKIWSLHIAGNLFDHIPMPVCQMTSLHTLNASQNRLTALPPDFDNLKNLRELNIADNKFTAVGTLVCLLQLKYLNVNNNRLQLLPVEMARLKYLKVLHAQGNRLQSVPDVLFNIQFLNIAHNELTSMTVGRLQKLVNFNVSHNQLEALPHGLALLRNLKFLRLNNNSLRDVNPDIGKLRNLETLDLSENKLTSLPIVLYQMPNLKSFNIHGNKIMPPAPGVLEPIHRGISPRGDNSELHQEVEHQMEIPLYKSDRLEKMKLANTIRQQQNGGNSRKPKSAETFRIPTDTIRQLQGDNSVNTVVHQNNQNNLTNEQSGWKGFSFFKRKPKKTQEEQQPPPPPPTSRSMQSLKSSPRYTSTTKSQARAPRNRASWNVNDTMTTTRTRQPLPDKDASWDNNNTIRSNKSAKSTKSKGYSKRSQSWNLNGTLRSHASLETLPGLDERDLRSYDTPPASRRPIARHRSESHLDMLPVEEMNVLSTAEFQIDEVHADFSTEDEDEDIQSAANSIQSRNSKPSRKAITRLVKSKNQGRQTTNRIKAPLSKSASHIAQSDKLRGEITDFTLLGVCTELETMMNKKLLHPALVLNTGLAKRFNEKVLKKTDDGLWRMSSDFRGEENQTGIEYSPVETFTITEAGGHYISNYDQDIQVLVPARSVYTTVHATIQVVKINNRVLSQVQELNRFAENVVEIGPIVMFQLQEEMNFNSQVKVTIPAPKKVKGHLMLLSIQGDNSCIPSSSGYQFNSGSVTFNTWHFTRRVAIVTKAKCKYKACKSMEQILQCLGLVNEV